MDPQAAYAPTGLPGQALREAYPADRLAAWLEDSRRRTLRRTLREHEPVGRARIHRQDEVVPVHVHELRVLVRRQEDMQAVVVSEAHAHGGPVVRVRADDPRCICRVHRPIRQ